MKMTQSHRQGQTRLSRLKTLGVRCPESHFLASFSITFSGAPSGKTSKLILRMQSYNFFKYLIVTFECINIFNIFVKASKEVEKDERMFL